MRVNKWRCIDLCLYTCPTSLHLWRLKYFSMELSVLLKQSLNIIMIKHCFEELLFLKQSWDNII